MRLQASTTFGEMTLWVAPVSQIALNPSISGAGIEVCGSQAGEISQWLFKTRTKPEADSVKLKEGVREAMEK